MTRTMDALRRLANSPTWQRDASAITSPLRLGGWFLMLNALIVVGLVTVYFLTTRGAYGTPSADLANATLGLGKMCAVAIFLALTAFLTFFVPLRVFGTFLGPRMGRYFDQIVLSGVSPWRYLIGKLWAQNVFLLVVLAVTTPYFLLCLSFGGITFGYVAVCFLNLVLYANLLVIAMLTAAMFMSEIAAIVLVITAFAAAACIGMIPIGPHPFNLTPVAAMIAPVYQGHLDLNPGFSYELQSSKAYRGPFKGLTLFQSHWMLFMVQSLSLLLMGGLAIALGPLNCLAKGVNTFGEAVFKGDKKRPAWFRKRFNLRRQAELSFLYENASRSWRSKDFARRWMLRELLLVGMISIALIWLYWLVAWSSPNQFYQWHRFFACGAVVLNMILFSDTWVSDRLRARKWEAGTLNTWHFLGNSLLIFVAFGWWPYVMEFAPEQSEPRVSDTAPYSVFASFEQNVRMVGYFVVVSCGAYALLRYQTLRFASKVASILVTLLFLFLLWLVPLWIGYFANVSESYGYERLLWLSASSPFRAIGLLGGRPVQWQEVDAARFGVFFSMVLHLVLAGLMTFSYQRRRKRQLEARDL